MGKVYQHYKGLHYKVIAISRHSETLEELVVYQALYGNQEIWERPLNLFLEDIFVNGHTMSRFQFIDSISEQQQF